MISRRRFLRLAAQGTVSCSAVQSTSSALAGESMVEHLLCISPRQSAQLKEGRRRGLMELAPVSLPSDPGALNNHFGWPVATRAGDAIIVVHRRIPGHWKGLERTDDRHSYTMMVRSTDEGKTWTDPFDLRQVMRREDRYRGGHIPLAHRYKFARDQDPALGYKIHLNAIGTTNGGGVVLVSDHGVFRSDDRGRNWVHFSRAMREDTTPGPVLYIGPRLFEHPAYGLVVVGHSNVVTEHYKQGLHPPDTTGGSVRIADKVHFRYSRDGGRSWIEEEQSLPSFVRPAEPAALLHENRLAIVSRSYDPSAYDKRTDTSVYAQLWSERGWAPLKSRHSNIRVSGRRGRQDTVDIDFNPVTGRIEAVVPARAGSGPGHPHPGKMSLNLWSIDPRNLFSGSSRWRFECSLFSRREPMGRIDGLHPGAAVIDSERGVQHVFVYMGYPAGPAGVFRLTRTLETGALKAFLG